jgi:hypothetical protein
VQLALTQKQSLAAQNSPGTEFLHEPVAGNLASNKTNEDDDEGNIELIALGVHLQVRLKTLNLCISDIDTIDEGAEPQRPERRQEMEIQLPDQLAILERSENRHLRCCVGTRAFFRELDRGHVSGSAVLDVGHLG